MGSEEARLSFRHSSGVWGVVAVIAFVLPGAGLIVATVLGVFDVGAGAAFGLFGLGVVMIGVGAAAALWRIEVVIERESRTVTEDRWLVGFNRHESYAWTSIERVEICKRPPGRFEVWLDASDGRIYLDDFGDHETARAAAHTVGTFAELPVVDLAKGASAAE